MKYEQGILGSRYGCIVREMAYRILDSLKVQS